MCCVTGAGPFSTCPVEVLLLDAGADLHPDKVVFEILEDVPVTSEVIDMCRSLRKRGYGIALDDFVPGTAAEALIDYATCVKSMFLRYRRPPWSHSRSGCHRG